MNLNFGPSSDNVGVTEYLLDLSADPSFSSYVTGYHNKSFDVYGGYTLSGLPLGVTYHARLRARDAAGNFSAYSNTASR